MALLGGLAWATGLTVLPTREGWGGATDAEAQAPGGWQATGSLSSPRFPGFVPQGPMTPVPTIRLPYAAAAAPQPPPLPWPQGCHCHFLWSWEGRAEKALALTRGCWGSGGSSRTGSPCPGCIRPGPQGGHGPLSGHWCRQEGRAASP